MVELGELKALPIEERLRLAEALWQSVVEEQHALSDHPDVIAEVRSRRARFKTNPTSGTPWEIAKARIRSRRG